MAADRRSRFADDHSADGDWPDTELRRVLRREARRKDDPSRERQEREAGAGAGLLGRGLRLTRTFFASGGEGRGYTDENGNFFPRRRPQSILTKLRAQPIFPGDALVDALHRRGFEIAVESNGTILAHPGIDWVCISPKAGSDVVQTSGNELKLVWPQPDSDIDAMERWSFDHFLVQPMDCKDAAAAVFRYGAETY